MLHAVLGFFMHEQNAVARKRFYFAQHTSREISRKLILPLSRLAGVRGVECADGVLPPAVRRR